MAKKEVKTDLWVYELLQEANIHLTPQGCDIKEIDEALRTASKSKTGNAGYPEYCGVVKDHLPSTFTKMKMTCCRKKLKS